jgi:hypothetical protein
MRSYSFALLIVSAAVAPAQPFPPFFEPLPQVRQFLQLSDAQVRSILVNNDEYNRWAAQKVTRSRQVQSEIAEETRKPALDANALGLRYVEVETICREMKERADEIRGRNLRVLNQDQATRLRVLEEALRLAPVISEATFANLIGGFEQAPPAFTSVSAGIGGGVIGGLIGGTPGCYLPFPAFVRDFGPGGATPGARPPASAQ